MLEKILPRVFEEEIALKKIGPGWEWEDWEIISPLSEIQPGDDYDAICSALNVEWLGFGFTIRLSKWKQRQGDDHGQ